MHSLYRNRTEAGQLLAKRLMNYAGRKDVLVLALPRGGVPVGFEVAKALHIPLDVCIVRKLGVPNREELAMGAIASGGVRVLNQEVINWLDISQKTIDTVTAKEMQELQRREYAYRGYPSSLNVCNRTVILIDDGIATGSTMLAAIAALRQQKPQSIVVAVPIAPVSFCEELRTKVDDVVCLATPNPLYAIGIWYENFSQVTDEEVHNLLVEQTAVKIIRN